MYTRACFYMCVFSSVCLYAHISSRFSACLYLFACVHVCIKALCTRVWLIVDLCGFWVLVFFVICIFWYICLTSCRYLSSCCYFGCCCCCFVIVVFFVFFGGGGVFL